MEIARRHKMEITIENEDRNEWTILLDDEPVATLERCWPQRHNYSGAGCYAIDRDVPCYWDIVFWGKVGEVPETISLERGLDVRTAKRRAVEAVRETLSSNDGTVENS